MVSAGSEGLSLGVSNLSLGRDTDCELQLWTDCQSYEHGSGGDNPTPPSPGMSFFEFDLARDNVDLLAIHRFFSKKLLNLPDEGQKKNRHAQETQEGPGAYIRLHSIHTRNIF